MTFFPFLIPCTIKVELSKMPPPKIMKLKHTFVKI